MITPRMRRRRRLLDAYVRIELEERGMLREDLGERSGVHLPRPLPEAGKENPGDRENTREKRPA
jgi:hypothetical protein